ncbi:MULTISPECIES: hypothetical protein [unclassified Streptomyces]|uniref:hypothetical protein n=1 Tax=unclassified Streptomyces TaxID=2593676 RepID=UPI0037162117
MKIRWTRAVAGALTCAAALTITTAPAGADTPAIDSARLLDASITGTHGQRVQMNLEVVCQAGTKIYASQGRLTQTSGTDLKHVRVGFDRAKQCTGRPMSYSAEIETQYDGKNAHPGWADVTLTFKRMRSTAPGVTTSSQVYLQKGNLQS